MSENGFAAVNGTRLYYESTGRGHPLVLIHSLFLDRRMWDDQVAEFAARHRVVRYDVRGFGRSEMPPEPYSDVEDLLGLLRFLNIDNAYLLGLSMGAAIALDFTLRNPLMVGALVLASSGAGEESPSEEFMNEMDAIFEAAERGDRARAIALWLDRPMMEAARENSGVLAKIQSVVSGYSFIQAVHPAPVEPVSEPVARTLAEIEVPTLVVVGDRDAPHIREAVTSLEFSASNVRTVIVPGAGHLLSMEQPAEFNRIVLDFLRHSGLTPRSL